MKSQNFFTYQEYITSVNITQIHYQFLVHIAKTRFNGDLSLTIDYLLKRYLVFLYKISQAPNKKP